MVEENVTAGGDTPEQAGTSSLSEKRKRILLQTNLCMVVVGGVFFVALNYSRGLFRIACVQAALCLLFTAMFFLVRRKPELVRPASWVYVLACLALSLLAFWEPRSDPTVFAWGIVIIFISMFLLGLRQGRIICLVFVPLAVVLLLIKHGPDGRTLNVVALSNFIALYIIALIFSIYSESTRADVEQQLKEANRKLQILSDRDGLSGLFNRRYFDRLLDQQWRHCQREGQPISLIMADIDFFKRYNDAYGHLEGDECIRAVSRSIEQSLSRPHDAAARYGGEEFVVLLPNTESAGAVNVAQHIQQLLEGEAIAHKDSPTANVVTLSFGVAAITPVKTMTPEGLLEQADKALYKSKAGGRNRITVS